jgi:hypothetical protein
MASPFPPLAIEIRDHIISFADRPTLCSLSLVDSDVRQSALRHLYAKLVFRCYANLEACFLGRSSKDVWSSDEKERAWRETGERKVLERRIRELRLVRDLEIDHSRMNPWSGNDLVPAIELPRTIIESGPFLIDTLRLPSIRGVYLRPLLQLLSPRRLIIPTYDASLVLALLPLTPDRSLVLDCYGHSVPSLLETDRSSILSIIWCPNGLTVIHQPRILVLLSHTQRLRIVISSAEQEEETKALLDSMRRNGRLVGENVEVVYREGLRSDQLSNRKGGGITWNDTLVEGLV